MKDFFVKDGEWRWSTWLLGFLLAALLLVGLGTASRLFACDTLSDCAYRIPVTISNSSASALSNTPVAVTVHPANLIAGGYLREAADDVRWANVGNTQLQFTAQGLGLNAQTWWMLIDSLAVGASGTWYLHMGSSDFREQRFRFDGTSDSVTTADHTDLDISNNLTFSITDANLSAIPSSDTYIARKTDAYGIGVRSGNTVFGHIEGTATSVNLLPNAAGDSTTWDPFGPLFNDCLPNYTCVDDAVGAPDNGNTRVQTSTAPRADYYNIADFSPSQAAGISVTVTVRGATDSSACTLTPRIRLAGVNTSGSNMAFNSTSYANQTTASLARPGGGTWTASDIDSLQIGMEFVSGTTQCRVDQIYATINYRPQAEVIYSPIVVNTDTDFSIDYNQATLRLFVNGTLQQSVSETFAINNSSSSFDVGIGINGTLAAVNVFGTSIITPVNILQWSFEPLDLEQTQQGTSLNSWTWTGTVEDMSAGTDQDGIYSLTRDMSNLLIVSGALEIKVLPADVVVTDPTRNTTGTLNVNATSSNPVANIPLLSFFTTAQSTYQIPEDFYWFVLLAIPALALGIFLWLITPGHNEFVALAGIVAIYAVGWRFGLVDLWIPVIIASAAIGANRLKHLVFG